LVTGGAGFIGSNLADRLLAEGAEVRVFDNLSTGFRDNVPADAELFEGDIRDEAAVRAAVRGIDVVFHHAAHRAVLQSVENPLSTDLANTHGTLLVLKAASDAGARRVVAASSSSVYGGAKQLPTPESAPLIPRSPYAVSKLAGEHYCRVWAELFGLETVALRYFNVYGPPAAGLGLCRRHPAVHQRPANRRPAHRAR
jgi:UDP-glucose 4-epimerase